LQKGKDQNFILTKEEEINKTFEENVDKLVEEVDKYVQEKDFNLKDLVLTYYEIFYRFKKNIPKDISDKIFIECTEYANIQNFDKSELVKVSYILSRFKMFLNTKTNAKKALDNVIQSLMKINLNHFSKEEIENLISIFSYNSVHPHLEFFTLLEPHILKYLNDYPIGSLIRIFTSYLHNFLGSNFFIQTVGFAINSNLNKCQLKELIMLLDISAPVYFNRPELSVSFTDIFPIYSAFQFLSSFANELKPRDIQITLKSFIYTGYVDKKLLNLISTTYLKFSEKEKFQHFIRTAFNFAVCDLESEMFWRKFVDVLKLNNLCLKNMLLGYEDMNHLAGLYDKNLVTMLNRTVNYLIILNIIFN
jgi:hypothetical protein